MFAGRWGDIAGAILHFTPDSVKSGRVVVVVCCQASCERGRGPLTLSHGRRTGIMGGDAEAAQGRWALPVIVS